MNAMRHGTLPACPHCPHPPHLPGEECEGGVDHGAKRWHRCLCLNLVDADRPCPPHMTCQGGTLGYADVWYLQRGRAAQPAPKGHQRRPEPESDTTLAAMFDGLARLLFTSSRDWGTYRVDAWLWAVLAGWDCETDHEHNSLCDHGGSMAETAERHGWDEQTVAKARRYRAAVRALGPDSGTPAGGEQKRV